MKLKKHFLRLALFSALAVGVVLSSCSQNGDGKGADTNGDAVTGTVKSESPTKLTCTDADGGVYTFTQITAPTVNANIRAGEEQAGGTFTYTINKVIKFSGIYTGDINQSTVTLTLKITKSVDSANVLTELADPKTTLFNITSSSFTTTIPELPVVERREVFGFFGPEWLINYVMVGNSGGEYKDRAAVASETTASREADQGQGKVRINVMSFTNEVPGLIEQYQKASGATWALDNTIIATTNGAYQPVLDQMLADGEIDIFAAEAAFVLKYSKGYRSEYAAPYEDFIEDFAAKLEGADIAEYSSTVGTNEDGKIVALGYQSTGCCFIYRRSIAKKVFGTDDPDTIGEKIGANTGSWDKFFEAAEECKKKGYAMISGVGDIYHIIEGSSSGWLDEDEYLQIDEKQEAFLDIAKKIIDNEWSNNTQDWTDGWYVDMRGKDGTYGDWAVCLPPAGAFWGGTWIFATPEAIADPAKKPIIADIIENITLDTSTTGTLYKWATGATTGTKDSVTSAEVMKKADGTSEFCGGQDIHKIYAQADKMATGDHFSQYVEEFNSIWRPLVLEYAIGKKTKAEAIQRFKDTVSYRLGFECRE